MPAPTTTSLQGFQVAPARLLVHVSVWIAKVRLVVFASCLHEVFLEHLHLWAIHLLQYIFLRLKLADIQKRRHLFNPEIATGHVHSEAGLLLLATFRDEGLLKVSVVVTTNRLVGLLMRIVQIRIRIHPEGLRVHDLSIDSILSTTVLAALLTASPICLR